MDIKELLQYVQKTNPQMTEEKLLKELSENICTAIALSIIFANKK